MKVLNYIFLYLFFCGSCLQSYAQTDTLQISEPEQVKKTWVQSLGLDSVCVPDNTTKLKVSKLILPTALISYGFAVEYVDGLKRFDKDIKEDINRAFTHKTRIDDVLVFVPVAGVFALDWCGVPARHTFKDRFIVSGTSALIGLGTANLSKQLVHRLRPDGSENNSFPSGHATTAFIGAHLLMKEYGHISPLIPIGGYTIATGVAFLRMVNNRHWFSDVVVGAGLGMLSVELSYLVLPYLSKTFVLGKTKDKSLTLNPAAGYNWGGVGMTYNF